MKKQYVKILLLSSLIIGSPLLARAVGFTCPASISCVISHDINARPQCENLPSTWIMSLYAVGDNPNIAGKTINLNFTTAQSFGRPTDSNCNYAYSDNTGNYYVALASGSYVAPSDISGTSWKIGSIYYCYGLSFMDRTPHDPSQCPFVNMK